MAEDLRFADILTNASAVANYLGAMDVSAAHILDSIALLQGTKTMDELGRPVSPLVPRPPGRPPGVEHPAKELVQRWYAELGSADATLDDERLACFVQELRALAAPA